MPTVTLLQLSRRRKDRVHVHLDHEYAFSLPIDIAATLRKGQQLGPDDIAELRGRAEYRQAMDRAVKYLAYRPRSRTEVARHLSGKDVPDDVVDRVLDRLAESGVIDDGAFAEWWVDNRLRHQPRGARALRHELASRGVAREIVSAAIEGIDEESLARELALSRSERYADLERDAFARRLAGFLQRRGFRPSAVWSAVNAAWDRARDQALDDAGETDSPPDPNSQV